jgi:hypothetical protein
MDEKKMDDKHGLTRRDFMRSVALLGAGAVVLMPLHKLEGKAKLVDTMDALAAERLRQEILAQKRRYAEQAHEQLERILVEHGISDPTEASWELLQSAAAPPSVPFTLPENLNPHVERRRGRA